MVNDQKMNVLVITMVKQKESERIAGGIKDHKGKDTSSHLLAHSIEFGHCKTTKRNFTVVSNGFKSNTMKRRIAEFLITKQKKPTLNKQE